MCNHAVKCYRTALENLVNNNPNYKGKGKLTEAMRKKLTKAARSAIIMRSKESDKQHAVLKLQHDLLNGPLHCFSSTLNAALISVNQYNKTRTCISYHHHIPLHHHSPLHCHRPLNHHSPLYYYNHNLVLQVHLPQNLHNQTVLKR